MTQESQESKAEAQKEDAARDAKNATLPQNKGQFGTDIETEDYRRLGNPPGQDTAATPGQHQLQSGEKS